MSDVVWQELFKRLDAVTAKLGDGARYAWGIYMRQEFLVNGVVDFFIGLVVIAGAAGLCFAAKHCWAQHCAKERRSPYEINMWDFGAIMLWILAGFVTLISLFVLLIPGIEHMVNPQYYALQDLLAHLPK